MKSVIYYCNWAIYARNHFVPDLPTDYLTHILYAFIKINPDTGEVLLSDTWSDIEKHYDGDSWNDTGKNIYGNFKQLNLLKKKHRQLNIMLSIGGWTYSPDFAPVAQSPAKRATFVSSAVKLVADLGLDGVDIDWEYPKNSDQADQYVSLLKEMRAGLNRYAEDILKKTGTKPNFYLTIAAPCGMENMINLKISQMDAYLDFWNLMAYDFSGPGWSTVTGHQANIYGGQVSADTAIDYYIQQGVSSQKLVLGMPLYGRVFGNTSGLGDSFNGDGGAGSWEHGVFDYKALPDVATVDQHNIASYTYNPDTRTLISYDTPAVAGLKAKYIMQKSLGGAMWWESSGDRPLESGKSVVKTVIDQFGGPASLRSSPNNCITFPESIYDNVRN
ncbi:glycoside hydrolase superfamily [Kockiozyma suomiensis]|uniref:glycoside hydrolase superfamily n=1 Tax=Kockiozyma suomiensis TaxID=1337062 RepID=UPI0033431749